MLRTAITIQDTGECAHVGYDELIEGLLEIVAEHVSIYEHAAIDGARNYCVLVNIDDPAVEDLWDAHELLEKVAKDLSLEGFTVKFEKPTTIERS